MSDLIWNDCFGQFISPCRSLLFLLFTAATLHLGACAAPTAAPVVSAEITLSDPCRLDPGESFPLVVQGQIPEDATISWQALYGTFDSPGEPVTVYLAPSEETQRNDVDDVITVRIQSGGSVVVKSVTCTIRGRVSQGAVPPSVPSLVPTSTETPTVMAEAPEVTPTASPTTGATATTAAQTPEATPGLTALSVAITEVMANPCGEEGEIERDNEFIELYNYGDAAADVNGWWFVDYADNVIGRPDRIVSWEARNPFLTISERVVTDSTILQPGQYALILPPSYTYGDMLYDFPPETVILTIAEGERLGDDEGGLVAGSGPPDAILLYLGSSQSIEQIISSYGTPVIPSSGDPRDIYEDGADELPLPVADCYSAQRVLAGGEDREDNWWVYRNTPGEGPPE